MLTTIHHPIHIHLGDASPAALDAMERIMANLGRTAAPVPQAAAPAQPSPTLQPINGLTPPAAGELWPGQGGHYICTLPAQFGLPARHLVLGAAEHDDIEWGGRGQDCAGATSQTDGRANTAALLADSAKHPAAEWAAAHTADGHSDFYLPSRFELFMCWLSAPQLFNKSSWYWSSSQYSSLSAWCQDFESGGSGASGEDDEFRARPARSIQLQPFTP